MLHRTVIAFSLSAAFAAAQCPFTSVTTQSIGPSCNAASTGFCLIVQTPTQVSPTLDTNACTLDVEVSAFSGCGATVPVRALAIGTLATAIPVPSFGPACTLHVAPDVLLASTGGSFLLTLPPALPPLSFVVQGFALSVPPFGAPIPTLSDGLRVDLQ